MRYRRQEKNVKSSSQMKENEALRRRAEDSSSIILHNFSTNATSSKTKMEPNKLVYAKKTSVNADGIKCPIRALCPIHFDTECVDVLVIKESQGHVNEDQDQLSELSDESVEFSEKEDGEWSEPEEEFGPYTPREDDERIVVELKKDENGIETRRVYKKICIDCGAEGSDTTRSPTPSVPEEESEKESESESESESEEEDRDERKEEKSIEEKKDGQDGWYPGKMASFSEKEIEESSRGWNELREQLKRERQDRYDRAKRDLSIRFADKQYRMIKKFRTEKQVLKENYRGKAGATWPKNN